MLMFKSAAYSKKEVLILRDAVSALEKEVGCVEGNCKMCERRHVCWDLASLHEHLNKLINN